MADCQENDEVLPKRLDVSPEEFWTQWWIEFDDTRPESLIPIQGIANPAENKEDRQQVENPCPKESHRWAIIQRSVAYSRQMIVSEMCVDENCGRLIFRSQNQSSVLTVFLRRETDCRSLALYTS
jgi:hypothetical protein